MPIAQGINKVLTFAKQAALLGGAITTTAITNSTLKQIMRRETGMGKLTMANFANTEITTYQQSTGKMHGLRSASYALSGLLSAGTYSTFFASILRRLFVAPTITGLSLISQAVTIAVGTPTYTGTITVPSSLWLTSGLKIGDVIRISAGSTNNANKNLLITNMTALVLTVATLNNTLIAAESLTTGTVTISVPGKKTFAPTTGQTQEYWMIEEWQGDINQSELYCDMVVGSMDISLPSSGNTTVATNLVGLNRSIAATQQITGGTVATTTSILTAVQGDVVVNNTVVANITGATLKIDCTAANMGGVIGTNISPDVQRGVISVTGQITAFYQDGVFPALFDASTVVSALLVVAADNTNGSDFVAFTLPQIIFDGDDKDDGQKGIVRTYPFTARMATSGGSGFSNEQTILSIQDSQA